MYIIAFIRIYYCWSLLRVWKKRARTTRPNPEKVTMTERTCLPLESDIRKMQLILQYNIRNLRKILIHGTDGI